MRKASIHKFLYRFSNGLVFVGMAIMMFMAFSVSWYIKHSDWSIWWLYSMVFNLLTIGMFIAFFQGVSVEALVRWHIEDSKDEVRDDSEET